MTGDRQLDLTGTRTIGADLDLTLLDSRDATAYALHEVNRQCGESVNVDEFVSRLGPPIGDELARFIAPKRVPAAIAVFRASFRGDGLAQLRLLPGALELGATLLELDGRLVVITSRIPEIAQACLAATQLPADVVVGGLSGRDKSTTGREPRDDSDRHGRVSDYPPNCRIINRVAIGRPPAERDAALANLLTHAEPTATSLAKGSSTSPKACSPKAFAQRRQAVPARP